MSSIQTKELDRKVALTGASMEEAKEIHSSAVPINVPKKALVQFDSENTIDPKTKEMNINFKDTYYSFNAEHSVVDGDVIVHFFLPKQADPHLRTPEGRKSWMEYWTQKFPSVLDPVAREYFEAGPPRLQAKYTQEVASWWLKAQGFGNSTDPQALVQNFLKKLDDALRVSN